MFAPIWMDDTIRYAMKNRSTCVNTGMEKLIQILPWMTAISRIGIPTDLNVNSSTTRTIRIDITLTTTLSRAKDFLNS